MRHFLVLALLVLAACGGEDPVDPLCPGPDCPESDAGQNDAGSATGNTDAGLAPDDAGSGAVDAGAAVVDAGAPPVDAGAPGPAGDDICAIHASGSLATCSNGYCHGRPADQNPSGGLHIDHSSPAALHNSLVNGEGSSRLFTVVPDNPAMSYLINKLRGTQDQVINGGGGDRMPLGGDYLDEDQIAQIERWIAAGASADCP